MNWGKLILLPVIMTIVSTAPSSTNYQLKSYDFGNGGNSSSSTNYQLNSSTGIQASGTNSSTNYRIDSGLAPITDTNVPLTPTFSNPSSEYDKLKIILDSSSNSLAARYLIAISSDNFVTTNYIQSDNTVGSSQALINYQTYAAWGGASGFWVTGLSPNTTYKIKVSAWQGNFSGSAFSPEAVASTVSYSLSFGISTNPVSSPLNNVTFPALVAGSVIDSSETILINLSTNALNGAQVLIKDSNNGLFSPTTAYTISSSSVDLTSVNSGYGAQITSLTQDVGSTLSANSPFNGISQNIGALSSTYQALASSSSTVNNSVTTISLKAKSDTLTPAGTDYSDTLTLIANGLF